MGSWFFVCLVFFNIFWQEFRKPYKLNRQNIIQRHFGGSTVGLERCRIWIFRVEFVKRVPVFIGLR